MRIFVRLMGKRVDIQARDGYICVSTECCGDRLKISGKGIAGGTFWAVEHYK